MADREVTMKLNVDAKGMKPGVDAMKTLAKETKEAAKQFDAAAEAKKKFEAIQRQNAVNAELYKLDPALNPMVAERERSRDRMIEQKRRAAARDAANERRNQERQRRQEERQRIQEEAAANRSMGVPGPLKAILGVGALNSAVGGLRQGVNERIASGRRITAGGLAADMAESVPLAGNMVGLIRDAQWRTADTATSAEIMGLGNGFAGNRAQMMARMQTANQIAAAQQQAQLAGLDAVGARRFANQIAGRGGQFITENRLGVSNEATGGVRLAAAEAQANLQTARDRQAALERTAAGSMGEAGAATKAREGAQFNLALAKQQEADARRRYESGDYKNTSEITSSGADAVAQARLNATVKEQQVLDRIAQEKEAIAKADRDAKAAAEGRQQLAQAELELAQRSLDVKKNTLDVMRNQEQVLKGGAEQFAFMSKGDQRRLERAAEKFKDGGFDSLSKRDREMLRGYGPAQEAFGEAARNNATANPVFDAINRNLGINTTLPALSAEVKKLGADIVEETARINAEFKEQLATAVTDNTKQLVAILLEAQKNAIAQIQADMQAQRTQQEAGQSR